MPYSDILNSTETKKIGEMHTRCIVCGNTIHRLFMVRDSRNYYRCTDCKLESIYPQPTDEELESIYTESYYDAWGIAEGEQNIMILKKATFQNHLSHIQDHLPPDARILDCGCATGYFLELISEKGYSPFGVELSEYGAEICAKKFGKGNIYHGQFEEATFANNSDNRFDAIFMSDYIEHVRDPERILRLAFSRLNTKGYLVITTPKAGSFSHYVMRKRWTQYKTEHLFYFSFANLSRLLQGIGFKEISSPKAYKAMSFAYFKSYFKQYRSFFFTPLFKSLGSVLPSKLLHHPFKVELGDMLVIARKAH